MRGHGESEELWTESLTWPLALDGSLKDMFDLVGLVGGESWGVSSCSHASERQSVRTRVSTSLTRRQVEGHPSVRKRGDSLT